MRGWALPNGKVNHFEKKKMYDGGGVLLGEEANRRPRCGTYVC